MIGAIINPVTQPFDTPVKKLIESWYLEDKNWTDSFTLDDEFVLKTVQFIYENSEETFAAINRPLSSTTYAILNITVELLAAS